MDKSIAAVKKDHQFIPLSTSSSSLSSSSSAKWSSALTLTKKRSRHFSQNHFQLKHFLSFLLFSRRDETATAKKVFLGAPPLRRSPFRPTVVRGAIRRLDLKNVSRIRRRIFGGTVTCHLRQRFVFLSITHSLSLSLSRLSLSLSPLSLSRLPLSQPPSLSSSLSSVSSPSLSLAVNSLLSSVTVLCLSEQVKKSVFLINGQIHIFVLVTVPGLEELCCEKLEILAAAVT